MFSVGTTAERNGINICSRKEDFSERCLISQQVPPQKSYYLATKLRGKVKGKVIPTTDLCGPKGGQRYSSTLPRPRHQKGVSGQQHAPAALYPRERPGTHFTGGWVGLRAGLEGQKISSPPGFDPGPSSPQSVAIPTELPGPQFTEHMMDIIHGRKEPRRRFWSENLKD